MEATTNIEAQIKEAAKKVFLRKGLAGTKLQEIADEAGIGRTAVHYYFRSKEKLFAIVWSEFFQEMCSRLPDMEDESLSIVHRMQLFADHYISTAVTNPDIDLFMLNQFNLNRDMFKEILDKSLPFDIEKFFLPQILKAVEKGEVVGDPKQIFLTFLSICFFPFAGMSMLKAIMNVNQEDYIKLMETRKEHVMRVLETAFK
ncbi:TetR/AcrR family transcriptional regulator [Mucilaginibacter sp. RS28]|uniref:TetR/AcrR family transcriptional regulator n=1 Tax=Mucilaginibacter straminoryzae TaxID=2932774 RepID=A0A9X2BA38_9SPHI|nr:TetR/AcrR family transcriptional regulator [Mucilaginibacter straminoryzae]MCJ8208382.1 TetR/AcrR family transcriptional regulator [Mucilaginibacter straminoryzae]